MTKLIQKIITLGILTIGVFLFSVYAAEVFDKFQNSVEYESQGIEQVLSTPAEQPSPDLTGCKQKEFKINRIAIETFSSGNQKNLIAVQRKLINKSPPIDGSLLFQFCLNLRL